MEKWESILVDQFGSAAVNKQAVLENKIESVPRYVSEYIIGVYGVDGITRATIDEACDFIRAHQFSGQQLGLLKQKLVDEFLAKVLDKFKIEIDIKKNENKVLMSTAQLPNIIASPSLAKEYPRLLVDGVWGLGELRYYPPGYHFMNEDRENKEGIIELQKFKPLQLSDISFELYQQARQTFELESWINMLISTMGLNYQNYELREKMILLTRLVPMVEESIFLMEFGPPGTGKTYCYDNISAHSRVISGSSISEAQLFYNLPRRAPGLIMQYDVVLFDEVDKVKNRGIDENVVNKLYKYMASSAFDRGEVEMSSTCGIMMVGNIPSEQEFQEKLLFEEILHPRLRTEAFLSRLAGLIPGWELATIDKRDVSITRHYGLMADYFSEILHELRRENFQTLLNQHIDLLGANIRDDDGVRKIMSGMLKLLCPHRQVDQEVLALVADFAVELRQKVLNQIFFLTGNSNYEVKLSWRFKDE